jgi:hypothetical protein
MIVNAWGVEPEPILAIDTVAQPRDWIDEPIVEITDPLAAFDAEAWEAHHAEHTGQYALSGDEVPDAVLTNGAAESVAEISQDQ